TIRLGGDEFVVVLECIEDEADAMNVAGRIVESIARPFRLGERHVNVGTSVGVAFINSMVTDGNDVLRNADTAMYRAKTSGKGRIAVFDQTMHEAVCERLELENQLRRAVDDGDFSLRYQPIVSLLDGRIVGVETLLRWQDKSGTAVPPSVFVPIVEEVGLIARVGEWVIENATSQFGEMLQQLPAGVSRDIYMGVNLSSRQLGDQSFLTRLDSILDRTGFDRQKFKLEMGESQDQRSNQQALACMTSLHESGIGLHIDDFGKGRSSLLCFQTYPIESVKIDRSFTAEIAGENSHAVITRAIIQLAHQLGARIIAEGVESESQLSRLRGWGCDLAQGYFFSPPMELEDLQNMLIDPMQSPGIQALSRPSCAVIPPLPAAAITGPLTRQ
ncbi:MAG: bifunctional diguanylate cyclase/phosphodiesterase, partial [Planctomycetota bacterium]